MYTEEQLLAMTRLELLNICHRIATGYRCPIDTFVPLRANKSLLIDIILESQEDKGGSS